VAREKARICSVVALKNGSEQGVLIWINWRKVKHRRNLDGKKMTYDRTKRSFLVLEVVVMKSISMSEIIAKILGGIIFSISILDIIFSTDFHFGYQ
jgi:hypothetical protein